MTVSGNGKSLCHKAREYYYELLRHDGAVVPEAIALHVKTCPFCEQQIRQLREALVQAENRPSPADHPEDEGVIDALSRQFELVGEPVTCSHVKLFLPDLLIPSREIRIPTPITVHVEHCRQCANDLAAIRKLGLTADQLKRLSLFYGQSAGHGQARSAAFFCDGTESDLDDSLSCREISAAELFDCVVPLGPDAVTFAGNDERRNAVIAHLHACRHCMKKARSLHRTIHSIAQRADSAISTRYKPQDDEKDAPEAQGPMYRYPVNVEILRREPARVAGDTPSTSPRPAPAGATVKFPRRVVLGAVAVVTVALLLLVNAPTTASMTVGSLVKAIQQAPHVRIISRYAGDQQPSYEILVSKDLIVQKIRTECILYDLGRRQVTVSDSALGPGDPVTLKADDLDRYRRYGSQIVERMFANALLTDDLSPVESVPSDRTGGNLSVYELTRTVHGRMRATSYRWRVSVDPATRLPVQIEYYCQDSPEGGWELAEVKTFEYLSEPEMRDAVTAMQP